MFCRGEGADSARDLLRKSAVQLGEARVVLVQEELHDPVSIGSELGRLGEAAERVDVIGVLLAQELEERGAIVTRPERGDEGAGDDSSHESRDPHSGATFRSACTERS
jgi:hypothetical protein